MFTFQLKLLFEVHDVGLESARFFLEITYTQLQRSKYDEKKQTVTIKNISRYQFKILQYIEKNFDKRKWPPHQCIVAAVPKQTDCTLLNLGINKHLCTNIQQNFFTF